MPTESDFLHWLEKVVPRPPEGVLGIGDDAAVWPMPAGGGLVVSVDMLMDTVDFHLEETAWPRIGRKALAVNLSDMAAMAARPLAALIALALPRQGGFALAQDLYRGMLPLAQQFNVAIVGGDTNSWDGPLVISATVLGAAGPRGVWRRDGARQGDWIVVTGQFGGSLLGHHLDFTPRLEEALLLQARYNVHAAVDCSDGLARDLARIGEASHLGAVVWTERVPISPAAELAAQRDGVTPLERALHDGEDFELILAVPPADAPRMLQEQGLGVALTHIGQFTAEPEFWLEEATGERRPLETWGFEHQF